MMIRLSLLMAGLVLLGGCAGNRTTDQAGPTAQTQAPVWPGPRSSGGVLLPNQWALDPVGKQVPLGDFPVNIAVHPDSRHAAVLHCGNGPHEIVIVDVRTRRVVSRTALAEAFYGIVFSPDGRSLYASGAGDEVVHAFAFERGALSGDRTISLRAPSTPPAACCGRWS